MSFANQTEPAPAGGLSSWLPRQDVPVLINSFNRLECLRELVSWLVGAGQRRIYVIDNASHYPPLLAYLEWLDASDAATVVRLGQNSGHLALWKHGLLAQLGIDTEFIYSDPDVIPAGACPKDAIGRLQAILSDNPKIAIAGLGLRLDDLPDAYRHKREAIDWEEQFWLAPAAAGLFHAAIDTTFALYRRGSAHCLGQPAIRTGWPYVASHRGWYIDEDRLTDEDLFYREVAVRGTSNWSVPALPDGLAVAIQERLPQHPRVALLARDGMSLPGYMDIGQTGPRVLQPRSLDGIYVADALERLSVDAELSSALGRAIKTRGAMVVHQSGLDQAAVRAILHQEPAWMAGWRLRKAVAAHGDQRVALMLQLEPAAAMAADRPPPEILFDRLDHWAGFGVVAA